VRVADRGVADAGSGPRRSHGAAIAATMVAMPAANVGPMPGSAPRPAPMPDPASQVTPPPVAATPPAAADSGGKTGNFRETLWFKKGDVEQMVAEAKAKVIAARGKPPSVDELPSEETKPLEDRYVDDGSVTADDRKKFSLRSGGGPATALPPVAGGVVPGERMSESEMLNEIGGGKRVVVIVGAVVVVLAAAAVLFMVFRGGKADKAPRAVAPVEQPAAPTPTAAAALEPAAAAPTAAAPPTPAPPPTEAAAPAPKAEAKAALAHAAHKHVKKHAGKKKH